jgi:hypothetical protein
MALQNTELLAKVKKSYLCNMRVPSLREVMRGFLSALSLLSLGLLWAQGSKEPLFRALSQRPDNPQAAPVKEAVFLELNRPLLEVILKTAPPTLELAIPLSSTRQVVLSLSRTQVLTPDFSVVTSDGKVVPYQPGLHYRGEIKEETPSLAAFSFFDEEIIGVFSDRNDNYVLGLWDDPANSEKRIYILYRDRDWTAVRSFSCEVLDPPMRPSRTATPPSPQPLTGRCIKIYFECDYQMYVDRGYNATNVANYVTGLFNVVHTLYSNENINTAISQIYVWTSTDPYASYNTSDDILTAFKNNRTTFNGNLAHLLSTRNIGAGGIAYRDVLCNRAYAYGYSNIRNTYQPYPTYSWTVEVVAHELGHNIGSAHTHRCNYWNTPGRIAIDECGPRAGHSEGTCSSVEGLPSNGGTIMSYCHLVSGVGINFTRGFGRLPGDTLRYHVSIATCLTSCGPYCSCPNYDFQLTPTSTWQVHSSWHPSDGCIIYRVAVTAGWTYYFKTGCGDGATANYDTYLELLDGSCVMLTQNDNGCESNRSLIGWGATYTGYAYLKVRGFNGAGGNYTLAYRAVNGCAATTSSGSVTAPDHNTEILIDNCTYAGQYNTIYSVVSGRVYRFRSSVATDYLTLTDQRNIVLAHGVTPLTWTATFSGNVRLHVHTNSSCGTDNTCRATYVQCTSCGAACVSCPNYNFQLTPTSTWQVHSSSHPSNGCKIYRVPVTAGWTYFFKTGCGDGATADYDTYLELLDGCVMLTQNNDGCESYRSLISWAATHTGFAYLKVRGYNGAGGSYTLAYRAVNGCVATTSRGSVTAPDHNTEIWIDNCTYAGQYNTIYSVVSGRVYRFRSSVATDYLTLTDGSNNVLAHGVTPLTWTATFSGNVRLHVHTNSSCGTDNTCRATYVQCTSCEAACVSCPTYDFELTPTSTWQVHSGSHPSNGCKIYRVAVTAGWNYYFKTGCGDGATANYDTYLELLDGSCVMLTQNDQGCESNRSLISWTAPYTGYAYLKVRGYNGAGGSYTLAYRAVNGCVATTSRGSVTVPDHNTEILIDNCTYAGQYNTIYSVVSGRVYRFRSSVATDYLTLTDQRNIVLAHGVTPLTWTATFSGNVRLHVHTNSSCGTDNTCRETYVQCASCGAACVSCPKYDFELTPTSTWQVHSGSHPSFGCKIYRVAVTAGWNYFFKTGCGDGATADYNTYLELLDDSCVMLTQNDDGCESNRSLISWSATYTGYAYLKVRGYGGAGGSYTLAYRAVNGCVATTSGGSITAPDHNTEILIDNCTYAGQYNTIYSVVSGRVYRFRSSVATDYLTLTDGSNNVLVHGVTPLTWTATFSGDVRLHVHTNSSCGTAITCRATYVQCTSCEDACSCPNYDFELTPTSTWQVHSSSHPSNGCKIYRMAVTAGWTYFFKTGCGDGATADYNTYLELLDGSCVMLTQDDDGCESNRSLISWAATYTGYAYLKVRGYNGAGGSYTLAYRALNGCVATMSGGSVTAPDHNTEILIDDCTYAGQYNTIYSVVSGRVYRFRSSVATDYLTLTDGSNNVLVHGVTPLTWTATFSGDVRLHVHTNSSCGTATTCRATYVQCTSCEEAACVSCPNYNFELTPTSTWQVHSSSHPSNGCKIYRMAVTAGWTYFFKTGCGDGATADYNTYLELLDGSCVMLTQDDDGCESNRSLISWTATYTGYAYLKVEGYNGAGGSYTLAYRGSMTTSLSSSEEPGVQIYPTLTDGIVWIKTSFLWPTPLQVRVYDALGREIQSQHFEATQMEKSLSLGQSGVYTVWVQWHDHVLSQKILVVK